MRPVPFIVGAPRSGTTLLRLMLDAHPEIAVPPETQFYPAVLAVDTSADDWLEAVLHAMTQSNNWADNHLDARSFSDLLRALRPTTLGQVLRAFYRAYAARFEKTAYGDKFPGNVLRMSSIARALPEARFVHIIRDGRDVAASWSKMWFGPGDDIDACVALWAQRVRAGREQAATGISYLEVRYEALVRDPRATLRAICDFAEIRFDDGMLAYHLRARERLNEFEDLTQGECITRERRLEIHKHTSRPPLEGRIGRWRNTMTVEAQRSTSLAAGGLLAELGYED